MDYFGGENVDLNALLEMLKSDDDPIIVHQHCLTLQNKLACCEEKQLQDFPLGGYITRLIQVLGHVIMMDFQVDTKNSIMVSFDFLMDILPQSIGPIVKEGLIGTICTVIQENMQYTELAGQAAKLFIKISKELPDEILKSCALSTLMGTFDFFDQHAQQKVLELCLNVSRHASSEDQFNNQVLPILLQIKDRVVVSRFQSDQKTSERVATIMLNIINSMNNFYSPSKHFAKFSEKFETLINCGLVSTIISCIGDYSATKMSAQEAAEEDAPMEGDNAMISTGGPQGSVVQEMTYTDQTISMFLQILNIGCKFSNLLIANILESNIIQVLTQLLPKEDQDLPSYTSDLTTLLNTMLPKTAVDQQDQKKVILFGPRQIYAPSEEPTSAYQLIKTEIETLEIQKRELYSGMSNMFFEQCAENLLQKLFVLYREVIGHQFREKCITIIDKILAVLPQQVVQDKINPVSLAELVLQILRTGTGRQVLVSLQITSHALQSNPLKFAIPFQREGTGQAISDLANLAQKLAEKYDKQSEEAAILESQPPPGFQLAGRNVCQLSCCRHLRAAENETVEGLQATLERNIIEVEKIKEILENDASRVIPSARKDMLGHVVKEKEISNRELAERLEQKKAERRLKSIAEEAQKEESKKKAEEEGGAAIEQENSKQEPAKLSQLIKDQAEQIVTDFLRNEAFLKQVSETHGEEIQLLNKFKELAREIIDESCSAIFDCSKTQSLMDKLTDQLTNAHGMTSFEFMQSGILQALEIFLTKAPSLALIEREALRNADRSEEMKHSEELILSTAQKQAKQQISQKEARCLLFRIKVAAHQLCLEKIGKFPLKELIQKCHDVISNNESILFEETKENMKANLDATEAIRSLNKREMIKFVYDPDGSVMERAQRKALGLNAQKKDQKAADEDEAAMIDMQEPTLANKAKSMGLPFAHLQGGAAEAVDEDMAIEENQSQVFQKRDRLYKILKQVFVDVQQAENLWMVEERLKKVDTLQKAQNYGGLMDRNPLRGLVKSKEEAEALAERFNLIADDEMSDLLDRIGNRIDEMLDSAHSQEEFELMKPGFIEEFVEEITDMAMAQDISDANFQLFFEMLHLEMEDKIQEHEMGAAENEDANMDLLQPDHIQALVLVKIKAFGVMIRSTRERALELWSVRKQSNVPDKPMAEEKKEAAVLELLSEPLVDPVVIKVEIDSAMAQEELKAPEESQAQTRVEFEAPPQIQAQVSEDAEQQNQEDIEMTDEQANDESSEIKNGTTSEKAGRRSRGQSLVPDKSAIDGLDLNELIKKNNGSDVDLQFYYNGKLVPQNTCFFEIYQQAQKEKKNSQARGIVKQPSASNFDRSNPENLFKQLMATMQRGEPQEDKISIYFRLSEKEPQVSRKNSLIDYVSSTRERTKSQAADLVSVQALNNVVQRLIDNEFSVFQSDNEVKVEDEQEKKQLEQSLKILKVMHFITKNTYLLSETGLNFLLSRSESGQELADLPTKDMDLSVPLAGRGNLFHHYKLDANILKQIQDPHKLVSGGLTGLLKEIFSSCSFLFHYETKLLYFKLVSFLGIDINRSLGYLRTFQQKKALGHQIFIPDQREERKGGGVNRNEHMQKEEVSRENIFEESLVIMDRIQKRKELGVSFRGEPGHGLGPTYEFFTLLAKKIHEAGDGKMWRIGKTDGTLFPTPIDTKNLTPTQIKEVSDTFRMAGTFIAKSIVDNKLIDLPISNLMWDLLLGKKLNLFDLRQFDPNQFKLLSELQTVANRKKEIEEMHTSQETKNRLLEGVRTASGTTLGDLCFYFTMPGYDQIELVHDGRNTELTLDNVQEYIDLVLHSTFYDCVNLQLQAFKKGFNSVLPMDSIRTFSTKDEIELMICGQTMDESEWKDIGSLQKAIKPDHGYTNQSRCYNDFLRFIIEMEPAFRPKFIQWLTGSKRLPKGGFGNLEHPVSVNRVAEHVLNGYRADDKCPSVNTCVHYVKFPEYSSYEILKHKFEQAVLMGADNFALD